MASDNLTWYDVATAAGVGRATLWRFLHGVQQIREDKARAIVLRGIGACWHHYVHADGEPSGEARCDHCPLNLHCALYDATLNELIAVGVEWRRAVGQTLRLAREHSGIDLPTWIASMTTLLTGLGIGVIDDGLIEAWEAGSAIIPVVAIVGTAKLAGVSVAHMLAPLDEALERGNALLKNLDGMSRTDVWSTRLPLAGVDPT